MVRWARPRIWSVRSAWVFEAVPVPVEVVQPVVLVVFGLVGVVPHQSGCVHAVPPGCEEDVALHARGHRVDAVGAHVLVEEVAGRGAGADCRDALLERGTRQCPAGLKRGVTKDQEHGDHDQDRGRQECPLPVGAMLADCDHPGQADRPQ